MQTGREKIKKIKWLLVILIKINSFVPDIINRKLFVFLRNLSGNLGLLLRYILIKNLAEECGDNISIHEGVYLKGIESISIGTNVSIHSMCYIDGSGGLTIGNDVSIAHASTIMTTSHTYQDTNVPIKYNKVYNNPVEIKNDVWIGCGCRILSGVTIHTRSIIAAGAVVNRNVKSHFIVGGIPAKVLKEI